MLRFLYLWIILDLIGMGLIVAGALQLSGIRIPLLADSSAATSYAIVLIVIGLLLALPLVAAIIQRSVNSNRQ